MPLFPSWQYMPDESKSMITKVGFSGLVMIFVKGIVRVSLPIASVGEDSSWSYEFLSKQ